MFSLADVDADDVAVVDMDRIGFGFLFGFHDFSDGCFDDLIVEEMHEKKVRIRNLNSDAERSGEAETNRLIRGNRTVYEKAAGRILCFRTEVKEVGTASRILKNKGQETVLMILARADRRSFVGSGFTLGNK